MGCVHLGNPAPPDCESGRRLDLPSQAALYSRLRRSHDLVDFTSASSAFLPRNGVVAALMIHYGMNSLSRSLDPSFRDLDESYREFLSILTDANKVGRRQLEDRTRIHAKKEPAWFMAGS